MPSVGQGLLLVRTPAGGKISLGTRPADAANVVIPKAGKALNRPGIDKKKVVFREGSAGTVFAYSILSSDPSKVVRESADGTKRIGRLVNGRFQVR